MPQGQATWETPGTGTKDYVVPWETEKNLAYEYRHRSAIGKLSKPITQKTVGYGMEMREVDVAESAAVYTKEVTKGDQVRFTLEQQLRGEPTYGDAAVRMGDYLAYMHAFVQLNKLDTPAFPIPEEMSKMRITDLLDPKLQTRNAMTMYLSEQMILDFYEGYLKGASSNLTAPLSEGGRAIDLGLGAGAAVSPENFLVAGNGFVSGVSGTSGYETALDTALGTLTNTATDLISRDYIHNLRYAITEKKIKPFVYNGKDVWFALCDPHLLARLSASNSTLYNAWLAAAPREKEGNPVFGHGSLELDDIIFMPDPWLMKFRPDITGSSTPIWGTAANDKRDYVSSATIALMIILGDGAMLEAHAGGVEVTEEKGRHGKGLDIAGHIKQSFMRTRYVPKDGRTNLVINQNSMTVAFFEGGLTL